MLVEFDFEFYYGNSWPELTVDASTDLLIQDDILSEYVKHVNYKFTTNNNSVLFIKANKKDSDTISKDDVIVRDQFVKIKYIRINDILLDLILIGPYLKFLPQYPQGYLEYCGKNNIVPANELYDTTFYFNGEISFEFKVPFWDWYAELRQQHILQHFGGKDLAMYFGVNRPEDKLLLNKLKILTQSHV